MGGESHPGQEDGRDSSLKKGKATLAEISRDGVGRLLRQTSARRGAKRADNDSSECAPIDQLRNKLKAEALETHSEGQQSLTDDVGGVFGGRLVGEGNQEREISQGDFNSKCEVHEGLDWEDGNISFSNTEVPCIPETLEQEVIVEFSGTPSSAKRQNVRRISAIDKELVELVHKVHLLCLLARGRLVDAACDDPLIQASLLSLLPPHLLKISEVQKLTADLLVPLVEWFRANFHVRNESIEKMPFKESLAAAIETREGTPEEVAALSVALFRALNLSTRFLAMLDVTSLKPDADQAVYSSPEADDSVKGRTFNSSRPIANLGDVFAKLSPQASLHKRKLNEDIGLTSPQNEGKHIKENDTSSKDKRTGYKSSDAHSCNLETNHFKVSKRKGDVEFELQMEMALSATAAGVFESKVEQEMQQKPHSSSTTNSKLNIKEKKLKSEVISERNSFAVWSRKMGPPLYWAEVYCNGETLSGRWVHVDAANSIVDGEHKVEAAVAACRRSLRYVVAFSGRGAKDVTRRYCMRWYTIASQRIDSEWWSAVLSPLKELESRAGGSNVMHLDVPLTDNAVEVKEGSGRACVSPEAHLKEGSGRVCVSPEAHHIEENSEALKEKTPQDIFSSADGLGAGVSRHASSSINIEPVSRGALEDMELETRALTEPLPSNQLAYKNHPLYTIERWLTRYQVLYPKGPVLGYCSGHPVYPRICVQTLHTKERWLCEGLQVKENESPAKVVKRSRKVNKVHTSEHGSTVDGGEGTIALYGKWQTEVLNLPPAVDGMVPKNERGQVDVWSEKCLPPGTVHLRFPRLVPVAKRLGVDFAPAMVGFEFRNGCSIPVYEGIVACAEFKDAILEAYAEVEERREEEEKKRMEAQALTRWYQLLFSFITRQRLKRSYETPSSSQVPINATIPNVGDDPCASSQSEANAMQHHNQRGGQIANDLEEHEHSFPLENESYDGESCVRTKRCACGFSIQVEEL
ncbi:DNA repair protein RAD4 isoform X2 [Amborella trichopoda]|uniref:DNA repair protein RAD4 isoform X2 n=1 Tax=Amborella trichopoda TaxID=13333 RepID=UPI0005D450E8|nr:DNA repair protein RAD4 isoform X2 [Amborella trichopoda]|eukprot:XP_006826912.2 DNA repair protein RAD4 isoform X2 [Amborella trichopoda]